MGALFGKPHWNAKNDVRLVGFARQRKVFVDLVGPGWQGCPMLVMDRWRAPGDAIILGEFAILQDVRAIGRALTSRHGGAGPHP